VFFGSLKSSVGSPGVGGQAIRSSLVLRLNLCKGPTMEVDRVVEGGEKGCIRKVGGGGVGGEGGRGGGGGGEG